VSGNGRVEPGRRCAERLAVGATTVRIGVAQSLAGGRGRAARFAERRSVKVARGMRLALVQSVPGGLARFQGLTYVRRPRPLVLKSRPYGS